MLLKMPIDGFEEAVSSAQHFLFLSFEKKARM